MVLNPDDLINALYIKAERKWPVLRHVSAYLFCALVILITGVAALIRFQNYDLVPLWLDEAWRANFILDPDVYNTMLGGSTYGAITAFGYVALIKFIALFQATEAALRLSSLAPAIAVIPLIIYTVKTMTGYRTMGLIAGIVLALNPNLVTFARELKPYSFELFIHLVSILLTLQYVRQSGADTQNRPLYIMLVWWLISILSATNFVFLFPGSVLYVLIHQYKNNAYIQLKITFVAAIFISAVMLAQYIWIWSAAPRDEGLIQFWSSNFYSNESGSYISWIIDHFVAMVNAVHTSADMSGHLHTHFYRYLFLIGIIASFATRSVERVLLLLSPLLLMVVMNALMMWPVGDIRVNIFVYGYILLLTMTGLATLTRFMILRWLALGYFIYVASVALQYVDEVYATKVPPFQDVPSVLVSLKEEAGACSDGRKITVVQNPAISHALRYYLDYHTTLSESLQPYHARCVNMKSLPEAYSSPEQVTKDLSVFFEESDDIWFVYAHLSSADLKNLTDIIEIYADISNVKSFNNAGLFLARRKK